VYEHKPGGAGEGQKKLHQGGKQVQGRRMAKLHKKLETNDWPEATMI